MEQQSAFGEKLPQVCCNKNKYRKSFLFDSVASEFISIGVSFDSVNALQVKDYRAKTCIKIKNLPPVGFKKHCVKVSFKKLTIILDSQ